MGNIRRKVGSVRTSPASPHLWGTWVNLDVQKKQKRFIPTPVGNIRSRNEKPSLRPVHPHTCGEHFSKTFCASANIGSSPHLWGTYNALLSHHHLTRFIPTPVGNIAVCDYAGFSGPVHPHTCGEHKTTSGYDSFSPGSSPHLWGTLCDNWAAIQSGRFIPTPVGNILSSSARFSFSAVHPHTCGEHRRFRAIQGKLTGSSPHLWGTFENASPQDVTNRFIPTPVGNISYCLRCFNIVTVHPHTCGEHTRSAIWTATSIGSSPHLWGTSDMRYRLWPLYRFIPTPVGNILRLA